MGNRVHNVAIFLVFALSVVIHNFYVDFLQEKKLTSPLPDFFWGPHSLQSQVENNTQINPFNISVGDESLANLNKILEFEINSGRLHPPIREDTGLEYGSHTRQMEDLIDYWFSRYNWKICENLLNQYPQFKTKIAGIDIHFQHVISANAGKYNKTLPLLILHGWPGSVLENQEVIPLLTDPTGSEINFEVSVPSWTYTVFKFFSLAISCNWQQLETSSTYQVIAPSLPGCGFSEGPARPGMGSAEMAQLFRKLMKRLGHDKFYIHGKGVGGLIATDMARMYPQK